MEGEPQAMQEAGWDKIPEMKNARKCQVAVDSGRPLTPWYCFAVR
jgi:hypothetical protein